MCSRVSYPGPQGRACAWYLGEYLDPVLLEASTSCLPGPFRARVSSVPRLLNVDLNTVLPFPGVSVVKFSVKVYSMCMCSPLNENNYDQILEGRRLDTIRP